jgi:hypothetical protein
MATKAPRATHIDRDRFVLAMVALLGLIAAGGLAFFYGKDLNAVQVSLISVIVTGIITKNGVSFSWFFDGVPDKPTPADPATGVPLVKVDDSPPVAVKPIEGSAPTS